MLSLYIFFVIVTFHVEATYLDSVAPQTILVNNMELPAVRTDLSQKDVDFIAEYQYADGDVVNVICINFLDESLLTMKYEMAGIISDKSTMNGLSSSKMIGFKTKLHSGHNNSYMLCARTEADDYTKVMVKFVMRSNFNNILSLKINGMFLRPHIDIPTNNHIYVDYKYVVNQLINVTCEVERADVELSVFDKDFHHNERSYKKTEPIHNKKAKMSFYLSGAETNKKLACAIAYRNGTSAEIVAIYFTAGIFPKEQYPLHMELPSSGRVMELYNDYQLHVILYEFKDGETLQLTCGELLLASPGPILYLELDSNICNTSGCSILKTLSITHKNENTSISCYLKEKRDDYYGPLADANSDYIVYRVIRVIFRERVPPPPTTTTTTTSSTTTTALTTNHTAANLASKILSDVIESVNQDTEGKSTTLVPGCFIGAVLVLLAVTVTAFCIIRIRKTKHIEITL